MVFTTWENLGTLIFPRFFFFVWKVSEFSENSFFLESRDYREIFVEIVSNHFIFIL